MGHFYHPCPHKGSETTKEEGAGALGQGEREDKSVSGHEQTSAHVNSATVDASMRPTRGLASGDVRGEVGGAHEHHHWWRNY